MRSLLSIEVLVLIIGPGCATVPTRAPQPIPRVAGKPLALEILGHRYTVPKRLDVVDHLEQPGIYVVKLQDRINRCETEMLFVTTTNREKHEKAFHAATDAEVAGRREQGLVVDERTGSREVLGGRADLRTLFLSRGADHAASVHLALYVDERQLGISSHSFCDDQGFARMTADLQLELVRSSAKTGPASRPAAQVAESAP